MSLRPRMGWVPPGATRLGHEARRRMIRADGNGHGPPDSRAALGLEPQMPMPLAVPSPHPTATPPWTLGLSWPLLLAALAGLAVLTPAWLDRIFEDGNIFLHMAAARWIVSNKALPDGDPFSFTMPGAPWHVQEWLSALLMYGTHQLAGWVGVAALMALCVAVTLAIMARFLLARLQPVHAIVLTVFGCTLMFSYLLARPHVLAWPLTALWFSALVSAAESGQRPPWWLLPVMVVWANLYGGFTLGLLLAGGIAAEAWLTAAVPQRAAIARRWGLFLLLALLASMLTPYGWRGLWFTVHLLQQEYAQSVIQDWKSPDLHVQRGFELWMLGALALGWAGKLRLSVMRILMLLGLVHLALMAMRSISTLGLIAPFLLAAPLAKSWYGASPSSTGKDVEWLDRWFLALVAPARPMAIALTTTLAVLAATALLRLHPPKPHGSIAPVAAVEAACAAGVQGPVLNFPNFGGFLLHEGIPPFIDSRMDMYGDALFKRFFEAVGLATPQVFPALLDEYRIGWTLLPPQAPANAVLAQLPGWRRVYADLFAVVYVREHEHAAR
jgi:hypothetical protein